MVCAWPECVSCQVGHVGHAGLSGWGRGVAMMLTRIGGWPQARQAFHGLLAMLLLPAVVWAVQVWLSDMPLGWGADGAQAPASSPDRLPLQMWGLMGACLSLALTTAVVCVLAGLWLRMAPLRLAGASLLVVAVAELSLLNAELLPDWWAPMAQNPALCLWWLALVLVVLWMGWLSLVREDEAPLNASVLLPWVVGMGLAFGLGIAASFPAVEAWACVAGLLSAALNALAGWRVVRQPQPCLRCLGLGQRFGAVALTLWFLALLFDRTWSWEAARSQPLLLVTPTLALYFLAAAFRGLADGRTVNAAPTSMQHTPDSAPMRQRRDPWALDDEHQQRHVQRNFLGIMHHELRVPQKTVIYICENLLRQSDLPPYVLRDLGVVRRLSTQMNKIVAQALSFVSNEVEPSRPVQLQATRVRDFIDELEQVGLTLAEPHNNGFKIELLTAIPEVLLLDEERLREIVFNLLSNANNFTDQGEVTVTLSVLEGTDGSFLRVAVKDTGVGMDNEALKRIFEPFYKGMSSPGVGLGLTHVKRLVDELKANMEVSSQPGQGSTFVLTCPTTVLGTESLEAVSTEVRRRDAVLTTRPSARMGTRTYFLSDTDAQTVDLQALRDMVDNGQVTDLEDWAQGVLGQSGLSRQAQSLAREFLESTYALDFEQMRLVLDHIQFIESSEGLDSGN